VHRQAALRQDAPRAVRRPLAARAAARRAGPGDGYFEDGSPQSVASIEVAEGSIRNIRLVVNPEKLGYVPPLERAEREED
jgi:hypothetical protein